MDAKIGGVMMVAESAGARSAEEWALLVAGVAVAVVFVVVVDWFDNKRGVR